MKDLLIVGGGIAGLALGVAALRKGLTLTLVEGAPEAGGASVRNFGMVWPLGQAPGRARELAMASRKTWLEMADLAGFSCRPCGAMVLAHADDEYAVLQEFMLGEGRDWGCELLSPEAVRQRCTAVVPKDLRGALWSPHELGVDPPEAIRKLTEWLSAQPGATVVTGDPIVQVGPGHALSARGKAFEAARIILCTGSDYESLLPDAYADATLQYCRLQMMRTPPQPPGWRLPCHIAGGLSLLHYPAFAKCPSMPSLRDRITSELPDYLHHGIHVMATQNPAGEVIVGDSHEYGRTLPPFEPAQVMPLIRRYLARMIALPHSEPAHHWSGIYLKRMDGAAWLSTEALPGVHLFNALGGAGMTLAFALAEEQIPG